MVEDGQRYYSDYSQIKSRKRFDPEASIDTESFGSLIAQYRVSEQVQCQVRKDGGQCGTWHQHGYLGRTKDGREVLIGNECGRKHFQANEAFVLQRREIDQQIKVQRYRERISEALERRLDLRSLLNTARSRIEDARLEYLSVMDSLPKAAKQNLRERTKTGNRSVIIEVELVERDDKGRKTTKWEGREIGKLSGLGIWTRTTTELEGRLNHCAVALNEAHAYRTASEKQLREWAEAVESIDGLLADVAQYENDLERFTAADNLINVLFVVRSHVDQEQIADFIIRRSSREDLAKHTAHQLVIALNAEQRKQLGGNIRVP